MIIKRILYGLLSGVCVGIGFIVVISIYTSVVTNRLNDSLAVNLGTGLLDSPPELSDIEVGFLGTNGSYSVDFSAQSSLSSGPGEIVGLIESNGQSIQGLRLRLALNGSAWSKWAVSGQDGVYQISVPYGEYRLDGYELDRITADRVLAERVDKPLGNTTWLGRRVTVSQTSIGDGPNLAYVSPVVKNISSAVYSLDDEIILTWNSYPGATNYNVQIFEKRNRDDLPLVTLFDWNERPETVNNFLSLSDYSESLKPNHFYVYHIYAVDEQGLMISESAQSNFEYDFQIVP